MSATINKVSASFTIVELGDFTIWFSYRTPIAFDDGHQFVIRRNEWGPTTGKHLNIADGGRGAERIDGDEFKRKLDDAISHFVMRGV